MGLLSLNRTRYAICIMLQIIPKSGATSNCANNGFKNISDTDLYTSDKEGKEWKLHILHIACKDLKSDIVSDSQATVDFAVELANNHSDILSNYEVVVHTQFVEKVSTLKFGYLDKMSV